MRAHQEGGGILASSSWAGSRCRPGGEASSMETCRKSQPMRRILHGRVRSPRDAMADADRSDPGFLISKWIISPGSDAGSGSRVASGLSLASRLRPSRRSTTPTVERAKTKQTERWTDPSDAVGEAASMRATCVPGQPVRTAAWRRAAVEKLPLAATPAIQPPRRSPRRYPGIGRRLHNRQSSFNPLDHQHSTARRQAGILVDVHSRNSG